MSLTKFKPIVCALPPSQNTGWGTAGRRITEELSKIALVSDIRESHMLKSDFPVSFSTPVIQAVRGVDMLPMYPHLYSNSGRKQSGEWVRRDEVNSMIGRRVGISFAEDNILLQRYALNAINYFEKIVCGSTWGRDCMVEAGVPADRVSVAIQGVDMDVFKPATELPATPRNTFNIWSAGKFEMRKSQDVVIRAVSVMMDRHKDVRLIAAWHNPWPASEATMAQSPLIQWNGSQFDACCRYLDMSRVELIGPEPHGGSVAHINRCDVGLFANRGEAGTNLPLMEAMSCGLPVIATNTHGHRDVTKHLDGSSIIPSTSTPIMRGGMHVANWYEPNLDATIAALEWQYEQWRNGGILPHNEHNRAWMANYTWAGCAQSLLEACTK